MNTARQVSPRTRLVAARGARGRYAAPMFEGLFQPEHLLIILVVALLVFGPRRLPQLGASLGKTIRDFKNVMNEPARGPPGEAPAKGGEGRNA